MKLLVYARAELIDRTSGPGPARAAARGPALLLEGSWPSPAPAGPRHSLDEAIDGRFEWIDQQAARWAELLGRAEPGPEEAADPARWISPAYLNALALRYYLVKLLRPLAYLTEVQPLRPGDELELVAAVGRDRDYAEIVSQCCRAAGAHCRPRWVEGAGGRPGGFPPNGLWRRGLARLAGRLQRPAGRPARTSTRPCDAGEEGAPCARERTRRSRRRVVLCGNPRLLDPVCRELCSRGSHLWWLYDRFAIGSWLRWQRAGVGQLVCNSSLGQESRLVVRVPDRVPCRGVNLAGPIRRWLAERVAVHGRRQTRLIEQIDAHLGRVRPDAVVLDEDATPLARAAVAIARRYGAGTSVVQHGAPCCRFGFSPLAADRILVWGRSSRRRLLAWGVPAERIRVTGLPRHGPLQPNAGRTVAWSGSVSPTTGSFDRCRRTAERPIGASRCAAASASPTRAGLNRHAGRPRRFLLLATVPPREGRPDAAALHLTTRTYAEMLRTAFAALAQIGGAELIVKLHPRSGDDPVVRAVQGEFPSLRSRVVRRGSLWRWVRSADCVVSCGSSAGVEATLAGVPVIQLAPPGATSVLPHEQWGLAGTARSEPDLRRLVACVAGGAWTPAPGAGADVFEDLGQPAAGRVADEVLAAVDEVEARKGIVLGRNSGQSPSGLPEDTAASPRRPNGEAVGTCR